MPMKCQALSYHKYYTPKYIFVQRYRKSLWPLSVREDEAAQLTHYHEAASIITDYHQHSSVAFGKFIVGWYWLVKHFSIFQLTCADELPSRKEILAKLKVKHSKPLVQVIDETDDDEQVHVLAGFSDSTYCNTHWLIPAQNWKWWHCPTRPSTFCRGHYLWSLCNHLLVLHWSHHWYLKIHPLICHCNHWRWLSRKVCVDIWQLQCRWNHCPDCGRSHQLGYHREHPRWSHVFKDYPPSRLLQRQWRQLGHHQAAKGAGLEL